ncbi:unnamed protein product [Adineta steineri]|uniref:TRPM SLOG domain-containing protein n=1 Tax=Adineta steineri TaxID=433720 RepID=A0A813VKM0_9BILA|nr:unnamed protein product [Adineta steineri]CAF1347796.1 unnamed protein product [Adineta steineri]CAF1363568.1 unnamed protein product [Adineta steineri]CAF3574311.1 unnamed protein product [Adineta steineri]CAF3604141.1 unnamed protein product [Adineta steineri]
MSFYKTLYENWDATISKLDLKYRRTCILFNKQQQLQQASPSQQQNDECDCGRLKRSHSYEGEPMLQRSDNWNSEYCSKEEKDMNNFGILYNPYASCLTKFIRCDIKVTVEKLYNLIHEDYKKEPSLIISILGGAKYFKMNKNLKKEFMRGIIEAATTADGWILTTGLNSGIAKMVGEAISQDRILNGCSKDVVSIGFTKWGSLTKKTRDRLSEKFTDQGNAMHYDAREEDYTFPQEMLETNDPETVELHHTYMLLFDNGQLSGYIGDQQRRAFVRSASNNGKNKCYPVTVIVEGGINTLDVILNDLKENRPVVIIDGSGRIANVLSDLLKQYPERVPERNEIVGRLKKEFQNNETNSDASSKSVDYKLCAYEITQIMNMKNRDLLNVYSFDEDINVAETIFNAIFKGYNMMVREHRNNLDSQLANQEHLKENTKTLLDLAIQWNSLEGIKQVFEDIKEKPQELFSEDIGKSFITSVKGNKPLLVNYLLQSQYDVLHELHQDNILELYQNGWNKQHAVAVAAESKKFLLTVCFDRVMNDAWYDKLDEANRNGAEKPMITLGLFSFGVLAPFYVVFRKQQHEESQEQSASNKNEQ